MRLVIIKQKSQRIKGIRLCDIIDKRTSKKLSYRLTLVINNNFLRRNFHITYPPLFIARQSPCFARYQDHAGRNGRLYKHYLGISHRYVHFLSRQASAKSCHHVCEILLMALHKDPDNESQR